MIHKKQIFFFCALLAIPLSYSMIMARMKTPSEPQTNLTKQGKIMIEQGQQLNLAEFRTLPNGIQYKIVTQGNGQKPTQFQQATVHYVGHLFNTKDHTIGKYFDSSKSRHKTFSFFVGKGQVIKGWDLMVADMSVGETRIVILPSQFAYGNQAVGGIIPAGSTLLFEIELLAIQ